MSSVVPLQQSDHTEQKIIVFGNSGSGKSTLAKKLAVEAKLGYLDLDNVAWQNTDPPVRKSIATSQKSLQQFFAGQAAWVVEGCYADLLKWVARQANHAIFLNLTAEQCQQNARSRAWEPHKYTSKAAQDAKLPMLLEWIAAYYDRTDEFSYQAHLSLYTHFSGSKQQLTQNQTERPHRT